MARTTLSISTPANRLVFQRGLAGDARIAIAGRCAWPGASVEARIVDASSSKAGDWTSLGTVRPDFTYHGHLTAEAGWYTLEVRARGEGNSARTTVERVGVGEVFLVVGHSVAQGGAINLAGAKEDRVSTIELPAGDRESQRRYQASGDPGFLPAAVGRQFGSDVQPAPAGSGTYFWAAFAEKVAQAQRVPVLLLNAAFGGTSLEHWAKSARGERFEHSFVNSAIRMPYIRLQHALTRYGGVTGMRAILSDQGQNDWPEKDEERIVSNYKIWIDQARRDTGFTNLAVVICRQSPPGGFAQIRRVQERMIREHPNCFPGADYDTLAGEDTTDKIHLSESGARKAAGLWAEALDAGFFRAAVPWQPRESDPQ